MAMSFTPLSASIFFHLRDARIPLDFDHVDDRLRLADAVLSCDVASGKKTYRQQRRSKNLCRFCDVNAHNASVSIPLDGRDEFKQSRRIAAIWDAAFCFGHLRLRRLEDL